MLTKLIMKEIFFRMTDDGEGLVETCRYSLACFPKLSIGFRRTVRLMNESIDRDGIKTSPRHVPPAP